MSQGLTTQKIILLVCLTITLGYCVMSAEAREHEIQATSYVRLTQIAQLSNREIQALGAETLKALFEDGWIQTERGLERTKVLDPTSLRNYLGVVFDFQVGNNVIKVKRGGTIQMPIDSSTLGTTNATLYYTTLADGKRQKFYKCDVEIFLQPKNDSTIDIEIISYVAGPRAVGHHHDHAQQEKKSQPQPDAGEYNAYTCRDYNGPFGNCVNYSSGAQKYLNFIRSDCYYSWYFWGLCWFDHGSHSFCNGTTRSCSWLIGHSHWHHCHR